MNPKELEVLKASVRAENMRLQACRAQAGITTPIDLDKNVEGIDWGTVAERVSDVSTYKYSSEECRIRWIGDQHPSINHSDWTSSEHKTLAELADSARKSNPNGRVDWVEIAKQLGTNRTPLAVMSKSVARTRHTWDAKSDRALLESVDIYGINNWMSVAQHVSPHATHTQCQGRYYKSLDPSIKRGAWTPEEDARLTKLVASLGSAWVKVAEFMPGRTNDQCHERWTEGMNSSSSKNVWTEEEDRRLKELVASMGNSWKAISTQIGNGKTGPSCRARFTKLSKSTTPTAASTLALMDGDQPTTTTGQSSPSAPLVQPVGSMLAEPSGSNQESSTSAKKRREDAPVAPAAKRRKIAPGSSEEPSAESDAMTPKPTPGSKPRPRPRPTTTVAKK
ncbi:nucleolar protein, variant 2 [Coprinopsis cinerea AmutBmut pab1-1]|nr:nucleolar protein, variant 2 [Coprinopsis cinerea AmutBmut pab1-1]